MAPDTAPPLERHEIERLLGQCLLRLQAFELRLKAIVATHRLSGPADLLEQLRAQRIDETRRKTMGGLVGDLMGNVLVPEGQQGLRDEAEDAPAFSFLMQIALPADEFSRIEAEHRKLTAKRNALVHHFLEEHDLLSEEGCRVAKRDISGIIERVTRADKKLDVLAADMDQVRKVFAEHLASPDVRDWFVSGRHPWRLTTIAGALHQAATALSQDGWTSVEAATTWITARCPDERPESHGCRTWRQLIHETRLFDLQIRRENGRRQAWYRPRPGRGEPT
ncbi:MULTISPECIES: OST-HTH/LOTUS domain-containing protein [unclassified Sulfitobacter]|uniref:OST-HTH/LOTUS domain-containing protein n=1 Tax=Sulfitobacter TaxID=60136 RepID=UPI000066BE56|nr:MULTISPECIES: OST-HTH/LOTUS domain-containing protein [unclassified Sulfitobacter]AXI50462.1 exonuclease [Sulfitobacter sp. SK025]EAP80206.1 hypothetical protein NAS141_16058 [Sulfitobacter sp. NAS-14.1]